MKIIITGPAGCGKSTLVKYLQKAIKVMPKEIKSMLSGGSDFVEVEDWVPTQGLPDQCIAMTNIDIVEWVLKNKNFINLDEKIKYRPRYTMEVQEMTVKEALENGCPIDVIEQLLSYKI